MTPPRLVVAVLLSVATMCGALAGCYGLEDAWLYDPNEDTGGADAGDAGAADGHAPDAAPADAAPADAATPDGG